MHRPFYDIIILQRINAEKTRKKEVKIILCESQKVLNILS